MGEVQLKGGEETEKASEEEDGSGVHQEAESGAAEGGNESSEAYSYDVDRAVGGAVLVFSEEGAREVPGEFASRLHDAVDEIGRIHPGELEFGKEKG